MNIRQQFIADAAELDRRRTLCTTAAYELSDGIEVALGWPITMEMEIAFRFAHEDAKALKALAYSALKIVP